MDKIILPAIEPIELQLPRSVPVSVPGTPTREQQVVLLLSLEHAEHIHAQLRAAIVTAKVNQKRR